MRTSHENKLDLLQSTLKELFLQQNALHISSMFGNIYTGPWSLLNPTCRDICSPTLEKRGVVVLSVLMFLLPHTLFNSLPIRRHQTISSSYQLDHQSQWTQKTYLSFSLQQLLLCIATWPKQLKAKTSDQDPATTAINSVTMPPIYTPNTDISSTKPNNSRTFCMLVILKFSMLWGMNQSVSTSIICLSRRITDTSHLAFLYSMSCNLLPSR